jgi:hypothetical protein
MEMLLIREHLGFVQPIHTGAKMVREDTLPLADKGEWIRLLVEG